MGKCVDYRRHEFWCDHRDKLWRWRTADGCSASCCEACWWGEQSPRTWPDLVSITGIDQDGIPYAREAWTEADALGDLLRQVQVANVQFIKDQLHALAPRT